MSELITQTNFSEMRMAHCQNRPGDHVMIRPKNYAQTPEEARFSETVAEKWFIYLHSKGFHRILSCWTAMIRGASKAGVMAPCADPAIFDTGWRAPDRRELRIAGSFYEEPYSPPDEAARERMRRMAQDYARKHTASKPNKKRHMTQQEADELVEEELRKTRPPLPQPSIEALRLLGMEPSMDDMREYI